MQERWGRKIGDRGPDVVQVKFHTIFLDTCSRSALIWGQARGVSMRMVTASVRMLHRHSGARDQGGQEQQHA